MSSKEGGERGFRREQEKAAVARWRARAHQAGFQRADQTVMDDRLRQLIAGGVPGLDGVWVGSWWRMDGGVSRRNERHSKGTQRVCWRDGIDLQRAGSLWPALAPHAKSDPESGEPERAKRTAAKTLLRASRCPRCCRVAPGQSIAGCRQSKLGSFPPDASSHSHPWRCGDGIIDKSFLSSTVG
jgi:hypothetical protein